jgi:hypothetical protein
MALIIERSSSCSKHRPRFEEALAAGRFLECLERLEGDGNMIDSVFEKNGSAADDAALSREKLEKGEVARPGTGAGRLDLVKI